MAIKKTSENPKITDIILLELETPGSDGCRTSQPYKVDRVTVYYVERDFLGENYGKYTDYTYQEKLVEGLNDARKALCDNPSPENEEKYNQAFAELQSGVTATDFYYKERTPVLVLGSEDFPAWIGTDEENSPLTRVEGEIGRFVYEWNPQGTSREGDYFVCWTWTPLPAGDKMSSHYHFIVEGDGRAVVTYPAHLTAEGKYETLLDRYLPEMYKTYLSDNDITPEVTLQFNNTVAKGFAFLEDFANQVIDLFDANALHESMLVYLGNLFNLRFRSSDVTLWRRQIKEAVPLFKKKGTLNGLKQAFSQAGMTFNSFVQYWQITSPYTWTESFRVADSVEFELEKLGIIEPIDETNYGVWIRREGTADYTAVTNDCVVFDAFNDCGGMKMTWVGHTLPVPIDLYEGDIIKVMYQYAEIPGTTEQQHENYIRNLPLADLRDEANQTYPPKNWNVKLITEDDPLFDILIPVKHPFHDWLIFGYIRTEFAYSENIYNMEEYNGSTRPSYDPCFIDKSFRDPCGSCLSSKYSLDVGIEELCNDRVLEAQDIVREYSPFHSQLHTLSFSGEVNDFVLSPEESVDFLMTIDKLENVFSGGANPFFHRCMEGGLTNWVVDREDLANKTTVLSGKFAVGYNNNIKMVARNVNFDDLGVGNHILEVMAPSPNAGTYTLHQFNKNTAIVNSAVLEPLDQSDFTFRLSNVNYGNSISIILQDNKYVLEDDSLDFALLGVKSEWDVSNTANYSGGPWKVLIPAYSVTPYVVADVVDGKLTLVDDGSLPTVSTSSISYTLLTDIDVVVDNSTTGVLAVDKRGYVNLNDSEIIDIQYYVGIGDYLYYNGIEYKVTEFDGTKFWIAGYDLGDVSGANIQLRKRLVDNIVGQFGYDGMRIECLFDHEAEFQIQNGANPPPVIVENDRFKENYLIRIGNGNDFYQIVEWDGQTITLAGRSQNWGMATGTNVAYAIVHFPKKQVNVQFVVFDHLDRDGHDPVIREILDESVDPNVAIVALSATPGSAMQENVGQEESISFTILRKDGLEEEGEL